MQVVIAVLLAVLLFGCASSPSSNQESFAQQLPTETPNWIPFKGLAVETADSYLLLDWEGKRGLELKKPDVNIEGGEVRVRIGAQATRLIRTDEVDVMPPPGMPKPRDRRTCCAGFAQVCCANGRVIHSCGGAAGCDFGEDRACD